MEILILEVALGWRWSPPHIQYVRPAVLFSLKFSACSLVLQEPVLCVPFLHGWQGSWGQEMQEVARGPFASSVRLQDEAREPDISSTRN